jgi:hypothetical protein
LIGLDLPSVFFTERLAGSSGSVGEIVGILSGILLLANTVKQLVTWGHFPISESPSVRWDNDLRVPLVGFRFQKNPPKESIVSGCKWRSFK